MPQISLKVNENGTLSIKDQNTATPQLAEDGLLKLYAPLASPALTGTPTAPTQLTADASTRIATTEYVTSKIATVNNTINSVSGASVTLTGAQEITGSKTFTNNYTKIQDVSGNVKLEVKNTGVEISGIIKPMNIGPVGFVYKDITTGNLITKSTISGDEIGNVTITDGNIADFSILSNKIATNAVTLAKINPSVYSVSNTPNTLVQRDSGGNMPANNNWTGNNAFSSNQFFIGGTVNAPIYKPFSLSFLTDSSGIVLDATNLFGLYLCDTGNDIEINLPSMTVDMIGIRITFRNVSTTKIVTISPSYTPPLGQILNMNNQAASVPDRQLTGTNNTLTVVAGKITSTGTGMWYII